MNTFLYNLYLYWDSGGEGTRLIC